MENRTFIYPFYLLILQNDHVDFPYPPGVRRDHVHHHNSSEMSEQSVIDDLYNLTESDVASTTEYVYDRSRIAYPEVSGSGQVSGSGEGYPRDRLYVDGSASGDNNEDLDDGSQGEEQDTSYPEGSGSGGKSREEEPDVEEDLVTDSNNDFQRAFVKTLKKKKFKSTNTETPSVGKKSVLVDNNSNNIKKKVQVAAEETATQRVQVNAGYENPEIPCLASGCSGVLLKWVLTFYGTEN